MQWLLGEGGASIEEADDDGQTVLLLASSKGHLSVVQWLLAEGGALVVETNDLGDSAVVLAAKSQHLSVLQWLLAEGGASITGTRIWLNMPEELEEQIDLLRTLALYQTPPASFVLLDRCPARINVLRQAAQLRGRLVQWRARRVDLLDESIPLPSPLANLVVEYSKPSVDDIWAVQASICGGLAPRRERAADAPDLRSLQQKRGRQS